MACLKGRTREFQNPTSNCHVRKANLYHFIPSIITNLTLLNSTS
jgi:hypothetical protein